MTTQKTPGKRILSVLLCIMMLLPMLPTTALAAPADAISFTPSGGGSTIDVQGGGYWKNDGTEGIAGSYNIKYDAGSKTLTLNNYSAGSIDTDRKGSSDLTINVNGNNTINGYIEKNAGTLNLAFSEGSTLTINAGDKPAGILIIQQQSGEPATLNINGKGTLAINTSTTAANEVVFGIHVGSSSTDDNTVNIKNMTVSINCQSSNGSIYGIYAKNIIIDESNVTIDASKSAGNKGSFSYGVYAGSETKITGRSDVKTYWNPKGTQGEGLSRFTADACTAVNGIAGYAHYRCSPAGAGSVTVTGGKAAVENGIPNKETAQFLTGDTVTLIPNDDLKNYYGFKGWSIGKNSFVGNSFTMPNEGDVKVQAYYKAFSQQPQFNYDSKSGECSVTFTYKAAKSDWSYYTLCFYKVNDDGSLTKSRVLRNTPTQTGTNWKLTEKITDITDTGLYGLENGTYRVGIPMNNGPVGNFVLYSDTFEVKVPQKLSAPTLWVDGVQLTGTGEMATAPLLNCWQALRINVEDIPEGANIVYTVIGANSNGRFDIPSYSNYNGADGNTTITVKPVSSGYSQVNIAVQAMKNIKGSAGSVAVWSEPVYVAAHFVTESELPAVTVNVTAGGTPVTDTTGTIKFTNSATIKATVGTTEPKIWGLALGYSLNGGIPRLFPDGGLTYGSDTYSAFVNVGLVSKWDTLTMGRAQMIHLENTVAQKFKINVLSSNTNTYNAAGKKISEAAAGETVTVKETGPDLELFAGWDCINATVADEKAPETTFIMPDKVVTIEAVYFDETVKEKTERYYKFHPNWLQAAAPGTGSIAADAVISSYETKIENPVTITQVWYEGDAAGGTPVETLSADRNYTGIITLSIPAACSFATDFEKSIKVRDADGNVFPVGTSNIQYTNGEKSMTITLHLVNKPTVTLNHYVGQNYSTSSTGSYPAITGHAGYSVTTLNYGTGGTGKITTAVDEMTITRLVLTCTDGAYLLPGSQVWVNGKAAAATSAVANDAKTLTTGEFTLPITSPSSITTANAIVTPPAAGQRPGFTAISAEPDKYKVELRYWVDDKGGIIDLNAINNETRPDYFNYKFIGGDKYQVYVIFTAVAGAGGFADNATFTINGQPASKPSGGSGKLHYCEFIATGTGGGTEPITYSATVGDVDLGTAKVGYKQSDIPTQYVAITNTGTGSLYTNFNSVKLTGAGADNFELPSNISTPTKIAAGASANSSWYIKPKEGLGIGTYTATIQFKDTGGKVTATGTVIFTVKDHEFDTTQWKSDPTYHWNPCKDDGCTVRGNEAAHNMDVTKGYKEPTFDEDGYTGNKYCSVCDRMMETGKAIAAGKYIRESKATMAPAAIHAGICANDIVFASLELSKYTVTLKRVYDLTDGNLNTDSNQYPRNKNFIEGHQYRIDFSFAPVGSYVYNTDDEIHWSTFTLNGEAVEIPPYTALSGSTDRMIKLTAGAPPTGVSVGGEITSYGSGEEAVTVTLTKQGETAPAFTKTVTGNSAAYSFGDVPAGNYVLKVEKRGHAPWTETVTVSDSDITKNVKVYLYGDVNRNGKVTSADALQVNQYIAGMRSFDSYQMALADVNKKNGITSADALWIEQRVAEMRDSDYKTIV